MTTPNVTSPNVRVVPKEVPVPADHSVPFGPTSGEDLAALISPYLDEYRAGAADINKTAAEAVSAGYGEVAAWWEGVEERVYLGPYMFPPPRTVTPTASAGQFPAAASPPAGPSVPVAKLSIVAVPVAEPERDPEEDAPAGRAVADDEPDPATDPAAVLRALAQKQDAAKEPDATKVIPVADAETTAVPAVKEGESDE